jgi:tetratricopeptide (TPR) repeat protein
MLISQPAFAYLEAAWRQLRGATEEPAYTTPLPVNRSAPWVEEDRSTPTPRPVEWRFEADEEASPPEPAGPEPARLGEREPGLTADQRRARAAALRASLLARQRRHEEAARAFGEALGLDPEIDLTEAPHFWELERAAHRAAADAYEAAGRTRDAMTLRGRIELRFRPKLVRSA